MKTAVINVKIDEKTKKSAQKLAKELGLNLSTIINGTLKSFVINKRITFDVNPMEEPSDYFIQAMKEADEDIAAGKVSPGFTNNQDATNWLKKELKNYAD